MKLSAFFLLILMPLLLISGGGDMGKNPGYRDPEEVARIRDVCVGTGQSKDVNFYLTRPGVTGDLHGQAPLLWFAYSRLLKY